MSADNGVYILKTKGWKGKMEYRITHAQAIENLWYEPDFPPGDPKGLNKDDAQCTFGKSRVFTDLKLAQGYAMRIRDEGGYLVLEYGIQVLDFSHIPFPRLPQEHKEEESAGPLRIQLEL